MGANNGLDKAVKYLEPFKAWLTPVEEIKFFFFSICLEWELPTSSSSKGGSSDISYLL